MPQSGNSFDQYRQTISNLPVGAIVQAPYNITDQSFLPCDGRKLLRAAYPKLSACMPNVGVFTSTIRTKTGTPLGCAIANNGTVWVVTGANGANNLYTTPDGITYTARTTIVGTDIRSIIFDGTNFVAYGVNDGQANAISYSTDGGSTWTKSASNPGPIAVGSSLATCMAWTPTLGTVGRFVCVIGGAGNAVYTSDDRGVTWTSRAVAAGGFFHVCWTGQKFIATSGTANTLFTSTDGITWTSQYIPVSGSNIATSTAMSIISDGNGRVVIISGNNAAVQNDIYTSVDHGVTWSSRQFSYPWGQIFQWANAPAQYTNGKFWLFGGNGDYAWISTDLVGWTPVSLGFKAGAQTGVSYKNGVYLINQSATSTTAYTVTEDVSYMTLPYPSQGNIGAASPFTWNNYMPFIKVQ